MPENSGAMLELRGASRTYGGGETAVHALKNTDLILKKGDFACLAGPSGSGKTTLLNLAGLLDRPTSGEILIEGVATSSLSKSRRADLRRSAVGFVFQSYNLLPVLTAWENVEYALLVRGWDEPGCRERVQKVLEEVGLEREGHKRPSELSGGQQQRVAIARAIAPGLPFVIADEPTANLDSETGEKLLKLLREVKEEENVTFLFSSHDPLVVENADRILKIRDGALTEDIA